MIKTRSIYESKDKDDGRRILITRYYPRGVKKTHFDEWARVLAPSRELLRRYKEGKISWDQFASVFLSQVRANPESREAVDSLVALAARQNVTLLCYERAGSLCHRYLVEEMVRSQMGKALGAPAMIS